jgi:two-component system chemotaxis sensor kinase CheA
VERDRASVRVTVSDDGRGIDRAAVLRKARAAGLLEADADADAMGDDELLALLARPGFSTAEQVTRLSGRGVGVDAVQAALRAVGGALSLRSVPGQGTAITMRLPLTLAIVRALLARAGDETYVMPLTHVRETLAVEPSALVVERGRERLRLRDELLPVVWLRSAVGLEVAADDAEPEAVVVEAAGQRAALVVDAFAGQQEVVVKRSPPVRGALRIFGGTTILGDGAPALILDAPALLHWSRS